MVNEKFLNFFSISGNFLRRILVLNFFPFTYMTAEKADCSRSEIGFRFIKIYAVSMNLEDNFSISIGRCLKLLKIGIFP